MDDYLNEDQKRYLLDLARQTIESRLRNGKTPKAKVEDEKLLDKRGVFVTLKVDGELRGCIGYPLPYKPLAEAVMEMAVAAATQDHRFQSLSPEDLAHVKIEISVLTAPRRIKDIREIEVGKHGIIISKGFNKGLLLPQVPLEYHWDLETYLRHGCMKAGLDENEWKKKVEIEVFEAQVFSEE